MHLSSFEIGEAPRPIVTLGYTPPARLHADNDNGSGVLVFDEEKGFRVVEFLEV